MARTPHFLSHARLLSGITFLSRLFGLARESIAAAAFGAGAVWSAFTFAFTIPNLFRKLLGEGAISAAFIPMYANAVEAEESEEATKRPSDEATKGSKVSSTKAVDPFVASALPRSVAADFASAAVNLLALILLIATILGELVLLTLLLTLDRPDYLLAIKLTMIMLPYAVLVCGCAFLGGVLQVHHRFAAFAWTSIVLNACLIASIIAAGLLFDLSTEAGRVRGTVWLSVSVLIAGVAQVLILLPSLKAVGFRFRPTAGIWTDATRQVILRTGPVALAAGVLQLSVLLDRGLAFILAKTDGIDQLRVLGTHISLPLMEGAAARLNWAQFLYQFPLGVFAIALATAVFPKLAREATQRLSDEATEGPTAEVDETSEPFVALPLRRSVASYPSPAFTTTLREGLEAALFIGLPASVGLAIVAVPAVRLMFERGQFTHADTLWTAQSTAIYALAIWAFSMQQIVNRAYFALGDTRTPMVFSVLNLLVNLAVELPLLWTPLQESGMAAGTAVSFSAQTLIMLAWLNRQTGGLGLRQSLGPVLKMTVATAAMGVAGWMLVSLIDWPPTTRGAAMELAVVMAVSCVVYFGLTWLMGVTTLRSLLKR